MKATFEVGHTYLVKVSGSIREYKVLRITDRCYEFLNVKTNVSYFELKDDIDVYGMTIIEDITNQPKVN